MKIDLHVHTSERSPCGKSSEEDMIPAAIKRGLGGLAFTDHGRLIPPSRLAELREKHAPFFLSGGIEVTVSSEDLVVLGVGDPALERDDWTYPELHRFVSQRDGFLMLAHPFRFRDTIDIDVDAFPPDAIELKSTNIRAGDASRIRALAQRLDVGLLCNSDAHQSVDVGRYYNVLPRAPRDDAELVALLRNGHLCNGRT